MSLHSEPIPPVPEETARVARAALCRGNPYLKLRDELGAIYQDEAFATLFPRRGQPAEAPWRLALTTVLQFAEGLSDRQAADAVRTRIDWKYALSLPLTDPGFDHTVLSEFRARLVAGGAEGLLLEALLARAQAVGLLRPRGRQRTWPGSPVYCSTQTRRSTCTAGTSFSQGSSVASSIAANSRSPSPPMRVARSRRAASLLGRW